MENFGIVYFLVIFLLLLVVLLLQARYSCNRKLREEIVQNTLLQGAIDNAAMILKENQDKIRQMEKASESDMLLIQKHIKTIRRLEKKLKTENK